MAGYWRTPKSRPGRAALGAGLITAGVVLASIGLLVLPDEVQGTDHRLLDVTPSEALVAVLSAPVLFGSCFLILLLVLKPRRG